MNVLVALETTINPKYAERRRIIESTWATRMPEGYIFKSFDGPTLGVDDSYQGLCEKTRAICRYAVQYDYEWLVVCDDDTYVRTERLSPPDCDYGGYVGPENSFYCAGSFYWLSRKAFSLIAETPLDPKRWTFAEDQWVGWTLQQHGIKATRLRYVLLAPCQCGRCKADVIHDDWTAYTFWIRFSPDLFAKFERLYGNGGSA